jgi:hypothetical protein
MKRKKFNTTQLAIMRDIPKGEYIRRKENSPILIKGDYDWASDTFCCSYVEDMNRETFIKAYKMVWVGFEY